MGAISRIEKGALARALTALASLGACSVCVNVSAQESETRVRIEYNAPFDCPTQETFVSEVQSRNPHIHRVSDDPELRTFIIDVARDGDKVRGHLAIRETNGNEEGRDVTGDTCAEVASALALITALSAVESSPKSDVSAGPPVAAAIEAPKNVLPKSTPKLEPEHHAPKPTPTIDEKKWTFDLGVDGALISGVTPEVLVAAPLFFEARAKARGFFAPALHVEFLYSASDHINFSGPNARFVWLTGAVEGCPIRFGNRTLQLEPCLRAEVGALEAEGSNISPTHSVASPWIALGVTARARWLFAGPFFFDVDGGPRAPLVRPTYFFEQNPRVFQPSAVDWSIGAGLGVRFL